MFFWFVCFLFSRSEVTFFLYLVLPQVVSVPQGELTVSIKFNNLDIPIQKGAEFCDSKRLIQRSCGCCPGLFLIGARGLDTLIFFWADDCSCDRLIDCTVPQGTWGT